MKSQNVTKTTRWYDDACGTALAMQLIGERWSMLIVRELMYGPRRFAELRAGLPGISANTLSVRLATLEQAGILGRRTLPSPASVQVYELTQWGYASEAAIMALGRWAVSSPLHDPSLYMSGASLMMSMRIMLVPGRAAGLSGRVGIRLGREAFVGTLADGRFEVARGEPDGVDALIASDVAWPILCVIYGHQPLEQWESGGMAIRGDRSFAERFVTLFELPEKMEPMRSAAIRPQDGGTG